MKTKIFLFCYDLKVHFLSVIIIISLMNSAIGMNDCCYISEFNFLGTLHFPVVSPKVRAPNELNKYWTATEEKKLE